MSNNLIENRTVRVFISSTFQDMQDERTELIRKTFPQLQQMAAGRDVTLTEVDLRWGITEEESKSGKVIDICFKEIENSIPFFIGIIGNRYGWIPSEEDIEEGTFERFSQVRSYVERRLSVTDMEMQFGVLDRTDLDMNAYFFIKDGEVSDADDPEHLAALKKAVRENRKYPVSTYSTPEDLADQVLSAFSRLLDELFPVGELSALEKERLGQKAVLSNLSRVYIKNEANFSVIDEWIADQEKRQMVITGASGLGKSALVANWVKEKLESGEELPYRIVYHFVGYGGSVGNKRHIVKVLCDEIRNLYGFYDDSGSDAGDNSLEKILGKVASEKDKPLLIVLDGINQIMAADHAKRLDWLPVPPRRVKILSTTLEDDETMRALRDRCDAALTLMPLTREERIRMVEEYLYSSYGKKLLPAQLERIVDDPQSENTLALKTLLDELANFGSFEKVDEKIEEYLRPDSLYDFYQVILRNYESDFGELLVRQFLSLIAVSRDGLSEGEILKITGTQAKPIMWSQFFCSFRRNLIMKDGLISFSHKFIREAVEGRYVHDKEDWVRSCREGIAALLEDEKTPEGKKTTRSMGEVPYQLYLLDDYGRLYKYLMDLDVFLYLSENEPNGEFGLYKYWERLLSFGHTLDDYLPMIGQSETSSIKVLYHISRIYWGFNRRRCLEYALKTLDVSRTLYDDEHPSFDLVIAYNSVGDAYSALHEHEASLDYYLRSLTVSRNLYGENHPLVARAYSSLGHCFQRLLDYRKGLDYQLKALDIYLADAGEISEAVSTCYRQIGDCYRGLRDFQKYLEYALKSLAVRQKLYGDEHQSVRRCFSSVANAYMYLEDTQKQLEYKGKILNYESKLLERRLKLFGETLDVADSYLSLGEAYLGLGDYQKCLQCQLKALAVLHNYYGDFHPDIANCQRRIGYTYSRIGNHEKELEYKLKALDTLRNFFGEENPRVASAYDHLGDVYGSSGDHQKALEYRLKALEILIKVFGEVHPKVASAYRRVGIGYGCIGDHERKQECLSKAREIRKLLLATQ